MNTWKYATASVRGRSHVKQNLPCQDRLRVILEDGIAVCALSDGAGSYLYPEIGAETVTNILCNTMKSDFNILIDRDDKQIKDHILYTLRHHLFCTSYVMDTDIREYASTLLFVAIREDNYIAGHIGDGVIGVLRDGNIGVLSHPENGEFHNITYFITDPTAHEHLRIQKGKLKDTTGFILMSDGISDSLYLNTDRVLAEAASQMLNWLDANDPQIVRKALEDNIKNVFQKHSTDDCSIILLKKSEPSKEKGVLTCIREFYRHRERRSGVFGYLAF